MSATVTSETVCAEARGEALRRADAHFMNLARAQEYRALEFEPVSEQEFRASNPVDGNALDLLNLVLDEVEQKMALEFIEHHEGDGSIVVLWRPAA